MKKIEINIISVKRENDKAIIKYYEKDAIDKGIISETMGVKDFFERQGINAESYPLSEIYSLLDEIEEEIYKQLVRLEPKYSLLHSTGIDVSNKVKEELNNLYTNTVLFLGFINCKIYLGVNLEDD